MKRTAPILLVLGLLVVCCASAWPMAAEYNLKQPIIQQPAWPAGLADFLNNSKPIYAYWVNWSDYFFFSGDTDAFNAFLERYSRLQGTPLTVSIHIGPIKVGNLAHPDQRTIPCDWDVFAVPPMIPDGGIVKGRENERIVTVEVWLGGKVELRKIIVPKNVNLVDGGDIAKFIAEHEKAAKEGKP